MSSILQINFLSYSQERERFTAECIKQLVNVTEDNYKQIQIQVICSRPSDWFVGFLDTVRTANFNCFYLQNKIGTTDYLHKINFCLNTQCKYSCSIDEDIFLTTRTWNYIIENINILDDPDLLFFAPVISNGIPSVEMFIEDFFSKNEKNIIYNKFCDTIIPNLWGVNYEAYLNKKRSTWNAGDFYTDVSKIQHHYKGIHPVRISEDCQRYLCEVICNNKDRLFNNTKKMYIEKYKLPYFCNSVFFINTEIWKSIITDRSLFKDAYDEVPLNLFKDRHNLSMGFIRNGLAIHMAYNTISNEGQKDIENVFINNFCK
tara:strand:+ start:1076 stop:2023 length:948 start_codon:yes stop_codon:yes gene_type:complete